MNTPIGNLPGHVAQGRRGVDPLNIRPEGRKNFVGGDSVNVLVGLSE